MFIPTQLEIESSFLFSFALNNMFFCRNLNQKMNVIILLAIKYQFTNKFPYTSITKS